MMYDYEGFVKKYAAKYGTGLAERTADFMKKHSVSSLMGDDLFEFFGTKTAISKTKFYLLRSALISFVEFTDDSDKNKVINRISQLSQVALVKHIDDYCLSTYRNLDEVINTLGDLVSERNLHPADAAPLQSLAILLWFGYSNEDIIEFKITDIDQCNIDEKYKGILKIYSELKYYRALPSGKVQNLVASDYLFRTANTNKLNENDVKKIISKINALVSEKQKMFSRTVLKKSAAFSSMYEKYKLDVSINEICKYFGKSKKNAEVDKLIIEYTRWVEELQK